MTSVAVPGASDNAATGAVEQPCRVEEALGRFSSHPRWSGYQLCIWYAIATAPLLAAALIFGRFVSSSPDAAVTLLVDYGRPLLLYGATAAGFAAGMSLTAAITIQARRCRRVVDDAGAPQWLFVTAVCLMVVVAFVMLVLSFTLDLPPRTRSLVTCLGILPLVMIQSLLKVSLRSEGPDGRPRPGHFRPWTAILPAVPVAFVLATQIEGVSRWLASFDFVNKVIAIVGSGASNADAEATRRWVVTALVGVVVSPLVLAATSAMMRFWTADDTGTGDDAEAPAAADVFPLLGERQPVGPSNKPSDVPDPESVRESFLENPFLVALLGGRPVRNDQVRRIFDTITESARRSRAEDPDAPAWERPSADVLVEGDRGSGRTAAVVAAVLHGALCEGEHALFLVPDESLVDPLVERVRGARATAGLDSLLDVESLAPQSVGRWLGATDATTIPVVIVGTLTQFERAFFEGTAAPVRRRDALRKIGIVVVEDLDGFGFDDLVHLPYMVNKIRLFLAATGDSCRTVIVTLPLTRAGRSIVRRRLCDARRLTGKDAPCSLETVATADRKARVVPFSGRASTPLFVQHVGSVARLLPPRHPIQRSWWIACGMPETRHLRAAATPALAPDVEMLTDREVFLDPPVTVGEKPGEPGPTNVGRSSWPWAIRDGSVAVPRPLPVEIGAPIDAGAGFLLNNEGDRITPVVSIPHSDTRIAEIKDQAMNIGRIDLAYLTRMAWRRLGSDYRFRRIVQHDRTTTIEAVPAIEGDRPAERSMLCLPVIDFPESPIVEDLGLSSGPCRGRISMYSLGNDAAAIPTHWQLTGRYDDRRLVVNISPPIAFSVASSVVAILFDQPIDRQIVETAGSDVMAAWREAERAGSSAHVPELGAAVSAALSQIAPGLERFARCIGLRLDDGGHAARPRYAVLLVEPATTGGSVRDCLIEMLLDDESLAGFLQGLGSTLSSDGPDGPSPFVQADYAIAPRVDNESKIMVDSGTVAGLNGLFNELAASIPGTHASRGAE